jgi:two-component system response regulator FlrC
LIIEQLDETQQITIAPLEIVNTDVSSSIGITGSDLLGNELKQQENQIIIDTLAACNGSRKAVAEKLGISPRTLRYKLARIREQGIELPA